MLLYAIYLFFCFCKIVATNVLFFSEHEYISKLWPAVYGNFIANNFGMLSWLGVLQQTVKYYFCKRNVLMYACVMQEIRSWGIGNIIYSRIHKFVHVNFTILSLVHFMGLNKDILEFHKLLTHHKMCAEQFDGRHQMHIVYEGKEI